MINRKKIIALILIGVLLGSIGYVALRDKKTLICQSNADCDACSEKCVDGKCMPSKKYNFNGKCCYKIPIGDQMYDYDGLIKLFALKHRKPNINEQTGCPDGNYVCADGYFSFQEDMVWKCCPGYNSLREWATAHNCADMLIVDSENGCPVRCLQK